MGALIIFIPWLIISLREYVTVPDSPRLFEACVWFDSIIKLCV